MPTLVHVQLAQDLLVLVGVGASPWSGANPDTLRREEAVPRIGKRITAAHKLIATATANTPCPVYSPWVRPTPKQHAYLLFGFTLARANARMLIHAASKRSSAK